MVTRLRHVMKLPQALLHCFPIPDTIKNVAASVLRTPPKQGPSLEYLKNRKSR